MKVIERKIINICMNCTVSSSANIGINIPFQPDELIVRQFAYSTTEASANRAYQLTTNMVGDQILCVFHNTAMTQDVEIHFPLSNFSQNRVWNFQVQEIPTAGTGAGSVSTNATGQLFVILEFVRFANPKK